VQKEIVRRTCRSDAQRVFARDQSGFSFWRCLASADLNPGGLTSLESGDNHPGAPSGEIFDSKAKGVCVNKEKGTVKWFNGAKGYGFIQRSTGEDVFVHFSVIQENGYRTLNEGEVVEFELLKGPKGLQAANVIRGNA
jgi:CspA family cold shock protein